MQNKSTIQQHDINKKCENLEQKLQNLLIAVDINDFFDKSLAFLSSFKSIVDNNSKIRTNLKNNNFAIYVINLRNYQQHHEDSYEKTIESNSHININNCMCVGSKATVVANNSTFNGTTVKNLEISSGRTLNIDGGYSLERRFEITNPFNFSYKFQGKTYVGYDKTPPAPSFYQILRTATDNLIVQIKENTKS